MDNGLDTQCLLCPPDHEMRVSTRASGAPASRRTQVWPDECTVAEAVASEKAQARSDRPRWPPRDASMKRRGGLRDLAVLTACHPDSGADTWIEVRVAEIAVS